MNTIFPYHNPETYQVTEHGLFDAPVELLALIQAKARALAGDVARTLADLV